MARSRKSVRERMKDAYLKLLRKMRYTDITVTDVVNEAGISRISYYRTFGSLEDILEECIDDSFADIAEVIKPVSPEEKKQAWKKLICKLYSEMLTDTQPISLVVPENAPLILTKVNAKLYALLNGTSMTDEEKYIIYANFGVVTSVGRQWLNDRFSTPLEDICELAYRLVLNNLELRNDTVR